MSDITINGVSLTYRVVAMYQYRENYGAHDWDGNGECPQYWKNKGGHDILIADGITNAMKVDSALVDMLMNKASKYEEFNEYVEYIFMGLSFDVSGTATVREVIDTYCDFLVDIDEFYNIDEEQPNPNAPIDKYDEVAEFLGYTNY